MAKFRCQTAFGRGLELAHDDTPPIVLNDSLAPIAILEKPVLPPAVQPSVIARSPSIFKKRMFWLLIILTIVLAICLGVGLGVGLTKNANDGQATGGTPTSPPGPTQSSIDSNNGTSGGLTPTQHGVLNDTSLAACVSFDENKHVFFQDLNGSIRHAISSSPNSWPSAVEFLPISPQPRNNTPLDVYLINTPNQSKPSMSVFYLSEGNSLQAMIYTPGSPPVLGNLNMSEFGIPPAGRILSVSRVITNNTGFDNNALLFYENSSSNITGHYGSFVPDNGGISLPGTWTWSTLFPALTNPIITTSNGWLGPPIAVGTWSHVGQPSNGAPITSVASFNPAALYNGSMAFDTTFAFQNFTGPGKHTIACKSAILCYRLANLSKSSVSSPGDYSAPFVTGGDTYTTADAKAANESDWVSFFVTDASRPIEAALSSITFFVANQGLATFSSSIKSPGTIFPYSRLAFANSTNSSTSYIYHQLNESIIIEDAYTLNTGWTSTAIHIPTT